MSEFARYAPYIAVDEGLRRIGGNKALYKRLLTMCQTSTEFAKFEEQITAGELAAAGDTAHAIKGMTGNLSMNELFQTSATICEPLRAGNLDEGMLAAYHEAKEKTLALLPDLMEQLV